MPRVFNAGTLVPLHRPPPEETLGFISGKECMN